MKAEDLFNLHSLTCQRALETMRAKNHDYSAGDSDRFANFRATAILGIKPELGILVRVLDKIARIQTFITKGQLQVKSESVDDAIEDCINYFILLKGLIQEESGSIDTEKSRET